MIRIQNTTVDKATKTNRWHQYCAVSNAKMGKTEQSKIIIKKKFKAFLHLNHIIMAKIYSFIFHIILKNIIHLLPTHNLNKKYIHLSNLNT